LREAGAVSSNTSWAAVSNAVVMTDSNFTIILPLEPAGRYFQLVRP
jgi:hypothetical protein